MNITHSKTASYQLNVGQTKKFKTVKIQLTFNNDLAYDTVTKRAMIPYLIKAVSAKYKTRKEMSIQLESMYSASFHAGVKKTGLAQEIVFDLTLIHNDYAIESDDLMEEGFAFLHEIFFNPFFDETIFVEEKRLLEEYFLSIYGNKMKYAILECVDSMFRDELYRLQAMGLQKDVDQLTLTDCVEAFSNMIEKDHININVIGDVSVDDLHQFINQYLPFPARSKEVLLLDEQPKPIRDLQTIIEKQDVQQGKLVLGYQFPVYYLTKKYYTAVVMNMILGGGPESLLFKRIREQLNKVYFIGSSYDQHKGSLLIYAGIDPLDYDEVMTEIASILQKLSKKDFDPSMLEIAKKAIINGLIESFDSSGSLASRINHLALFNQTFDPDILIQKINDVSIEDVSSISTLLRLDTSYFLRGIDHE